MDLKETDILGEDIGAHWYYASKARAMSRMLDGSTPRRIVDVGAGSGFFSRHLLSTSSAREAWCVDISYPCDRDCEESQKILRYRRSIDYVDANLVLLMDVLEHVDDDVGLLREYVKKVPDDSEFLLTVPAFNWLWSSHDDFLEHRRRYTLPQVERVVRAAGLEVRRAFYYFGLVLPLAAGVRVTDRMYGPKLAPQSQLKRHCPAINRLLAGICALELPIMRLNRLGGLSIFCLAGRKARCSPREVSRDPGT